MKLILTLLGIGCLAWIYFYPSLVEDKPTNVNLGTKAIVESVPAQSEDLEIKSGYVMKYFEVNDVKKLNLIPNYGKNGLTSLKMMEGCEKGINAGFFDTDRNPLGLVIAQRDKIHEFRKSSLFNGFININDIATISTEPDNNANTALQSGPMLIKAKVLQKLSLQRDKNARRSIAIIDDKNKLIMATIFDNKVNMFGPTLEELPQILFDLAYAQKINIKDAINMDGGSASAFYANSEEYSELQTVGGWWCLRP